MTVKELMEILKQYDDNMIIQAEQDNGNFYPIEDINVEVCGDTKVLRIY